MDRPQFHFAPPRGWSNDPNGLFFDGKTYHVYYQANPELGFGTPIPWYHMRWSHAKTDDFLHWTDCPDVLLPDLSRKDEKGNPDSPWSGSAVIDHENCAGFGKDAVLFFFTSTARGECLAYSLDGGMTLQEYAGNPILRHPTLLGASRGGRDPKILFHKASGKWIMAVFEEVNYAAFYSSENLRDWQFESRIHGFYECINFFELNGKWILMDASGQYSVGSFDGHEFVPETHFSRLIPVQWSLYAGQAFWGTRDVIMLFWQHLGNRTEHGGYTDRNFHHQLSLPVRLSLGEDLRLRAWPVIDVPMRHFESPETDFNYKGVSIPRAKSIDIVEDTFSVEAFLDGGERYFSAPKITV